MSKRRPRPHHNDSGAALLLAIGSMLMIGSIGAGLAAAVTSSLNNRTTLEAVRNRQYAADGAIEEAIAWVRTQDGPTIIDCSSYGSRPPIMLNGVSIRVDWQSACPVAGPTLDQPASDLTPVPQRNVIFSACVDVDRQCSDEPVLRPAPLPPLPPVPVIIRAQVNFAPAVGPVTRTYIQSWSVNR